MVTIFTYKPSLVRIDARNFELLEIHKHTIPVRHSGGPLGLTLTHTYRTDYITLRRS